MDVKVCRKVEQLAELEIEKQLKERSDWRLDYIQKLKFGKEISPFIVRRLLDRSTSKKSTFTQRRTDIFSDSYNEITEVRFFVLFCYSVLTSYLERIYVRDG